MKKHTQAEIVRKHLEQYGEISSWEAFSEYGITRLSAVIFDLRKLGLQIESRRRTVKTNLGNHATISIYFIGE